MANEFKVKNGLIVIGDLTTSGTITINGALAATQSWVTSQAYLTSASLSGYATQSYVTSAISSLIDAAPAALDTLNELAAALGDDASFSTTITNSIAAKLPLAGGTLTGALTGTSATFSGNVTLGNNSDLVFQDLAGTFPTTGKGFDWTLNNDGARIYAIQPNSDSIDFVFQLRDNATTNDRFVFWVDEWQGPAYDKYPLIISGGTEFDLKDSALYTNTVLRLSNSGVLQNVTGNISMFTNNAGYLTSYSETDTLQSVTNRGGTTTNRLEFQYSVDRYSQAWKNTSTGAYWWVTTDSDKLGLHLNGDGDKFYFSNTGDFYSTTNGWLSSALAAKQNASTAINTSNIGSQSVSYANSAGYAGYVNNQSGQLLRYDNRTISPSETNAGYLQFGFTSWDNNGGSPYADYLHMRSYTDGSGGNDNLVMFLKSGIGMRIYQQTFGSATAYSSYADVWHSGNLTNLNQLTNGPGYITASALSPYLPLAGGTMSGILTFSSAYNAYIYTFSRVGLANQGRIIYNNGTGSNMFFGELASNVYGFTPNAYTDTPALAFNFSTNNVGIGTASPLFNLQVGSNAGTIATTTIRLQNSYLDTNGYYGFNIDAVDNGVSGHDLRFLGRSSPTGAFSELVRIKNTGNVGIGISSPAYKLDVNGETRLGKLITTWSNSPISPSAVMYSESGYNTVFAGNGQFSTSYLALMTTGNMSYMGGNIGIGTTSPQSRLDLASPASQSTLSTLGYSANAQLNIRIPNSTGDVGQIVFTNDAAPTAGYASIGVVMTNGSGVGIGDIIMSTKSVGSDAASTERMRITSSGYVGIGTSSPGWKLHVAGESYTSGVVRIGGTNPFYFEDYGGGWYMADSSWVRTYNAKSVWVGGGLLGGDGGLTIGYGGTGSPSGGAIIAGNVGIGTSSPNAKLHVEGPSSDGVPVFRMNGTTAPNTFNYAGSLMNSSLGSSRNTILLIGKAENNRDSGYIGFNHSGTNSSNSNFLTFGLFANDNILNITGAGNVGIGTASPNYKLDVAGSINIYTGNSLRWGSGDAEIINSGYNLLFKTYTGSALTEKMRITPGGTLLLGDVAVPGESAWYGTAVFGKSGTDKVISGYLSSSTNGAVIGGHNSGLSAWAPFNVVGSELRFSIQENRALTIDAARNVGIGTSSPIYKLQVAGSAYVNGGTLFIDSGEYLRWGNSNQGIVGVNDSHVAIVSGGTTRQTVYADGRTYFPGLDLSISNVNGSHGSGTYFRGDGGHFVFGLSSGNTLYLNYGNSAGILRTFGTWYHESTQILSTSRVLTNVSGNISMFTNDAGYLTSVSDVWVNTSGDSMTGTLSFAQPVGLAFANGQYIKDNSSGGLIISSGAAVNINGTSVTINGNTAWHAGNDGSGSGLDADTVDGIDSGSFLRSDVSDSFSGTLTMATQRAFVPSNYGHGVYGLYSAERYQHVWSMGAGYDLPADGVSNGNGGSLYGLAWSYNPDYSYVGSNAQSKPGLNHQLLLMMNGITYTALGNGIWTSGTITTTSHGNSSQWNTAYSWGNHASAGYLTSYSETDPIYVSERNSLQLNKTVHPTLLFSTLADYNKPSGYSTMIQPGSYQTPLPSHGYYHIIARRDGGGGYGALLQSYNSHDLYHGNTTESTTNISWYKIWNSGDFTSTNVSNWNTAYGWGNHASQSYATTSYVTTQINNLINGAPGVLDTLDELAAALGDDSNFATTVTNSIAGKVSKAGDTMTGNLTTTGLTVGNGVATGRQPYGPLANANIVLNSSAADSSGVCGIEFLSGNNYPSDGASIYFQNNAGGGSERAKLTLRVENDQEDFIELRAGKVVINANTYSGGGQNPAVIFQHNDSQIVSITSGGQIDASGGNSSQWNTAYGWGNHSSAGYALNSSLANYLPLSGGVIGGALTVNGNLTVNGTITENSSIKLKENVETSEGNLEKVVNLRPVTYNKIGSQTTELGLIAEEVAEVYPEFVQYDENGEPIGVHYSRLTAALIGAVKELTNQVQELNKKING